MNMTSGPRAITAAARWAGAFILLLIAAASRSWAAAPELEFHAPAAVADAATPGIMRDLAGRLIPVYQDADPLQYLANLSALQLVAGDYAAAYVSRQSLRDRRRRADATRPVGRAVIYDIYAQAKAAEAENRVSFADSFTKAFRDVVPRLSDQDAYAVEAWLGASPSRFQEALQESLDQQRTKDSIDQSEAVKLVWTYLSYDAYRSFAPLVQQLLAEDDGRRYATDDEILIKTADGVNISASLVRPKEAAAPLPTLLEFSVYDSPEHAKECAAHGYAGVVAYARGTRATPRSVVPYQHDGEDARAVIDWIAKQAWSDGRVGMYGDGYSGFTAWAAATHVPPALKAIASSGPSAPGIDFPMQGNIFENSAYRWSLQLTETNAPRDAGEEDDAAWRSLDQKWYRSGRPYRDLGRLYGHPNPIFIRWLNHPSYDRYWQKMIPYREQFAHINIPVLTTTGYFAPSEPGALYYFTQHYQYDRHADHVLLIGPYDDALMQRGPSAVLHGYDIDPAALIDVRELRYEWFDHIFKGGAMPDLLKNRVNYEVMGANEWRHAPSFEAMAAGSLRFYLEAAASGVVHRLSRHKNSKATFARQTVNFADRTDAGWMPPVDLISQNLAPHHGVMFVSDPLAKPTEFSGLFSGRLDFTVNKMDMDVHVTLYERQAGGAYVRLFEPTDEFRASYARDRVHRHLLKAGERQELAFRSERMTSRRLEAGSRLVMVLGINKRPDREINYGTGNDVSAESIADAKIPLKIRWYSDSYVDIPVRR